MPRSDERVSKDLNNGGAASTISSSPARRQPQSSDSVAGKTNVLPFRRSPDNDGPEPNEPTPHHGPRLVSGGVLECVAIDMANRWWNHETSIVTIRRKLNVSIPEAERIVRRGMRLRKVAA